MEFFGSRQSDGRCAEAAREDLIDEHRIVGSRREAVQSVFTRYAAVSGNRRDRILERIVHVTRDHVHTGQRSRAVWRKDVAADGSAVRKEIGRRVHE